MGKADTTLARTEAMHDGAPGQADDDARAVHRAATSLEDAAKALRAMAPELGITGDSADAALTAFTAVRKDLLACADDFAAAAKAARMAHDAVVHARAAYRALPDADIDGWQKGALIAGGTIIAGPLGTLGGAAAADYLADQAAAAREAKAREALAALNAAMTRATSALPGVIAPVEVDGLHRGDDEDQALRDAGTGDGTTPAVRAPKPFTPVPVVPRAPGGLGGGSTPSVPVTPGPVTGGGGVLVDPGRDGGSADGSLDGYLPGTGGTGGAGGLGGIGGGLGGVGGSSGGYGGALAGGLALGGASAGVVGLGRGLGLGGLGGAGGALTGGAGGGFVVGGSAGGSSAGGSTAGGAGARGSGLAGSRSSALAGGTSATTPGATAGTAGGRTGGMAGGAGGGGAGAGSSKKRGRRSGGYLGPDIDIEDDPAPIDLGPGARAGHRGQNPVPPAVDDDTDDDTW